MSNERGGWCMRSKPPFSSPAGRNSTQISLPRNELRAGKLLLSSFEVKCLKRPRWGLDKAPTPPRPDYRKIEPNFARSPKRETSLQATKPGHH